MTHTLLASTRADADTVAAIEAHHAEMAGTLAVLVHRVVAAAHTPDGGAARSDLVQWCRRELLPHAAAEEGSLYAAGAARPATRLLVTAMVREHGDLTRLVAALETATGDPIDLAATAVALRTLLAAHLDKENLDLLPVLAADPTVSLPALLDGMHELLGGADARGGSDAEATGATAATGATTRTGCGCGCGHAPSSELPELDATAIPHAVRHATVLGALDSVRPGDGLVLVAPHDPLPLLAQIEERMPAAFDVTYLERGPEAWRLQFVRS